MQDKDQLNCQSQDKKLTTIIEKTCLMGHVSDIQVSSNKDESICNECGFDMLSI